MELEYAARLPSTPMPTPSVSRPAGNPRSSGRPWLILTLPQERASVSRRTLTPRARLLLCVRCLRTRAVVFGRELTSPDLASCSLSPGLLTGPEKSSSNCKSKSRQLAPRAGGGKGLRVGEYRTIGCRIIKCSYVLQSYVLWQASGTARREVDATKPFRDLLSFILKLSPTREAWCFPLLYSSSPSIPS